LQRHYSEDQVEWIVLVISMMGFLNKFMDSLGVDLEGSTANEVRNLISASGWTPGKHLSPDAPVADVPLPRGDTFGSNLSVIPLIPSALALERRGPSGGPKRWPAVGDYLRQHLGARFQVLSRLSQGRAIRAIAVMLRDNFDPRTTVIGLPAKALAGIV